MDIKLVQFIERRSKSHGNEMRRPTSTSHLFVFWYSCKWVNVIFQDTSRYLEIMTANTAVAPSWAAKNNMNTRWLPNPTLLFSHTQWWSMRAITNPVRAQYLLLQCSLIEAEVRDRYRSGWRFRTIKKQRAVLRSYLVGFLTNDVEQNRRSDGAPIAMRDWSMICRVEKREDRGSGFSVEVAKSLPSSFSNVKGHTVGVGIDQIGKATTSY